MRELYDDLLLHKFDRDEIYTAFRQMARTDKRLLFAGLSDSNEDIDRWLNHEEIVHLSSAGRGYYYDLLAAPAYLQWAFGEIAEVRSAQREHGYEEGQSLVQRVAAALVGFRVVIADELQRLNEAWEREPGDRHQDRNLQRLLRAAEMSCQSVTADVFFRSYPAFVTSLLSNYRSLSKHAERNTAAIRRARELAVELKLAGEEWIGVHEKFFAKRYDPWQERMDAAESDIAEILRA